MLTEEQKTAKDVGIERSLSVISEEDKNSAFLFFVDYATTHYRFTASAVLQAYRENKNPDPDIDKGWRDGWGGITTKVIGAGVMHDIGIWHTPEAHRHVPYGKWYQSNVYKGDVSEFPPSPFSKIELEVENLKTSDESFLNFAKRIYQLGVDDGISLSSSKKGYRGIHTDIFDEFPID